MPRTGKHKSCFLTRISVMSIWESEMQSIIFFDYWCFSHTASFLRTTVKNQNCVQLDISQWRNVPFKAGNSLAARGSKKNQSFQL